MVVALAGPTRTSAGPALTEEELITSYLARGATAQRSELLAAHREGAEVARAWAPSWRVEALHEESTSSETAFVSDVLSVGVEIELGRANATASLHARERVAAAELAVFADVVDTVSEVRLHALAGWRARREAGVLRAGQDRIAVFLDELSRQVEAGEQARFDLERLRAFAATHEMRARVAEAAARAERTRLAALTGQDVASLEWGEPRALPGRDGVLSLVLGSHPLLTALRRRVAAASVAVELAGRTHAGSLDLRAGYRRDDAPLTAPGEGYELQAAYTLPAFSLREQATALARAERGELTLLLARAERRIAADVDAALARLAALEPVETEEPVGVESLRAGSLRRYRSGEATLTELLDVLAGQEERELLQIGAAAARRQARLELDRASGLVTAPDLARLVEEVLE